MPAPAFNKEPVWFYPRDSNKDGVCYYIRDGRQQKHYSATLLAPHPEAGSNPIFKDMVFLYREPYGDQSGVMGDLVKDWYAPLDLIDDIVSVQEASGGYQSGILFARGTEPPEKDERIDVLGVLQSSASFTAAWVIDPATTLAGPSLIQLTRTTGTFTGDEVYLKWTTDVGNLSDIDGAPVSGGISIITRHINSTVIQIEVPYDASVTPSGTMTADIHEACYILEGYSDSESAPGVLGNLFNTRSFTYALALPQDSPSYDDEMFISLITEQRAVPSTWRFLWSSGYPSASSSTAQDVIGYAPRSKLVAMRSKRYLSTFPGTDPVVIRGTTKAQMPRILTGAVGVWANAWARKEDYLQFDEAWNLTHDYWGPAAFDCASRTDRYFREIGDIAALLSTLGVPVNYVPKTMNIPVFWTATYVGANVWARAQVRNIQVGPAMADNGSIDIIMPSGSLPAGIVVNPTTGQLASLQPGSNILFETDAVAWGTEVLWAISTRQARWGYWIVEALYITLPAKPY